MANQDQHMRDMDQEDDRDQSFEYRSDEDQEDDEDEPEEEEQRIRVLEEEVEQFRQFSPNLVRLVQNVHHTNIAAQLDRVEPPQCINYCDTQERINDACMKIRDFVNRMMQINPEARVPIGFHTHEVTRVQDSKRIVRVELIALYIEEAKIGGTCYLLHFTDRDMSLPPTFIEILTNEKVVFVGGKKVVSQMENVRIDWQIMEKCGHRPLSCIVKKSFERNVADCLIKRFKCGKAARLLSKELKTERSEDQAGQKITITAQKYAATYVYLCLQLLQFKIVCGP